MQMHGMRALACKSWYQSEDSGDRARVNASREGGEDVASAELVTGGVVRRVRDGVGARLAVAS